VFSFFYKYTNFNKYYLENCVSSSVSKIYKYLNFKEYFDNFSGKVESVISIDDYYSKIRD